MKGVKRLFILFFCVTLALGLLSCEQKTRTSSSTDVTGITTVVAKLPKTGQTKCYSSSGSEISCAGTGQDGELQKGVASPNPRFTVDTTGNCVIDNQTGLMWSKNADLWGVMNWQSALDKIKLLNQQGGLCGYTDWRLPNIKELESLVDTQNFFPALPTGHPFSNVQSFYYWSSTTFAYNTVSA